MSRQGQVRNTPTDDQKDALRGSHGAPSAANRYITQSDPLMADPANHATTHEAGGDDVIEVFAVVSVDPVAVSPQSSPPIDSVWFIRNGTSPETISLRANIDGVIGTLQTWNAP